MRDALLVVIVVSCALYALRSPAFGMLAFVCLSFLNPGSMTWTIGRHLPFAQLIAIGTLVGYVFSSEPKRLPLKRETLLLLALWAVFGLTSFFADYPDRAWERYTNLSKILLMVFLSMSIINTRHRLHMLMRAIAFPLGFYGLKGGIFFILSGGQARIWGPEGSFLEANNAIGLAMAMNIPLMIYLRRMETNKWIRRALLAAIVFSYPAVIGTFSRGAWLGLTAVSVVLTLRSKHRFLVATAGVLLVLILLPYTPERVAHRYQDLENYDREDSAVERLWSWRFATRVALAHPFVGAGFDYYGVEAYLKYWPEFLDRWPESRGWSCHSTWFTILSEHGVPAFTLWAGLFASIFLSLRRLRSYWARSPDREWIRPYANMLEATFVGYMVTGTFYDAAYFDMFYQLVAVIVILKTVALERAAQPETAPTGVLRGPAGLAYGAER